MPSAVPSYPFVDVGKLLHCGVYCLLRKGEVVYVGKSKQPFGRLDQHIRNRNREMPNGRHIGSGAGSAITHNGRGIKFDWVWFVPCMLGQLDVIEKALIKQYLPKYNKQGMPKQPIPTDLKALLANAGWQTMPPPEPQPQLGFIDRRL